MHLKPLGDRILVKPRKKKQQTKSGLYLPDGESERANAGRVVAVGHGRVLANGIVVAPDVQVGDNVLFSKYSGDEIKVEEEDYIILAESDVMAVIETDASIELK